MNQQKPYFCPPLQKAQGFIYLKRGHGIEALVPHSMVHRCCLRLYWVISRYVGPIHGTEIAPLTNLATLEEQLQSLFRCTSSASPSQKSRSKLHPLWPEKPVARGWADQIPPSRPLPVSRDQPVGWPVRPRSRSSSWR